MEFNEGLAKLEGCARLARIALWTFVAVGVLTAGSEGLEASGTVSIETGTGPLTEAVALVYLAFMVAFIASVVIVAMWFYRAHANLRDAGMDGLEFTPGWAVGWYFIPFANLFKPFQAMRELWNASRGEEYQFTGEAPLEVKWWWTAWIVGNILSNIGAQALMRSEGGTAGLAVANAVSAAGTVITVLAAVLLVKVIDGVTRAQRSGSTAARVFA